MTDTEAKAARSNLIERLRQYDGEQWETAACYNGLRDEAAAALAENDARIAGLERQVSGYQRHLRECEQIAGKALGYPWYKDDQLNFPGATEADGVCIGEHVGDTIVSELATALTASRAECEGLRAANAKLRCALQVFGDIAEDCDDEWGDVFDFSEDDRVWVIQAYGAQMAELSIDDFRAARAALSQKETGDE